MLINYSSSRRVSCCLSLHISRAKNINREKLNIQRETFGANIMLQHENIAGKLLCSDFVLKFHLVQTRIFLLSSREKEKKNRILVEINFLYCANKKLRENLCNICFVCLK